MHMFKGNIGSGLYAMGDAIRNAGLILGPPVVIILGVICVHCQHLLVSNFKYLFAFVLHTYDKSIHGVIYFTNLVFQNEEEERTK